MLTRAATRAALALHRPAAAANAFGNPDYRCRHCGTAWPCRTRTAAESVTRRREKRGLILAVAAAIVLAALLAWAVV